MHQRRPTKGTSKDEWETPPLLFARLDVEFYFTFDAAASLENSKCDSFWTKDGTDALTQSAEKWAQNGPVWVNPPYSKTAHSSLLDWCRKAAEVQEAGGTVVMLIPAAIETQYFQTYVIDVADEVRLPNKRLRFVGAPSSATQPNVIVVYRPHLGPTRWVRYPISREEAGG